MALSEKDKLIYIEETNKIMQELKEFKGRGERNTSAFNEKKEL